jgi:hypothetical protein
VVNEEEYVSVPVKAGSVLLIHGLVFHRSRVNYSSNSRNVYTFHIYDAGESKWSSENWYVNLIQHIFIFKSKSYFYVHLGFKKILFHSSQFMIKRLKLENF